MYHEVFEGGIRLIGIDLHYKLVGHLLLGLGHKAPNRPVVWIFFARKKREKGSFIVSFVWFAVYSLESLFW